jgi:hypothetical protein
MHDAGVGGPYAEDWFNERYGPLLDSPPIELFIQGGCHVFAFALVSSFGYQLRMIPGDEPRTVSHVYCVSASHPSYAIDVLGFSNERNRVFWDFGRTRCQDITVDDLKRYFRTDREAGLFAPEVFWKPAYAKALARIENYLPYYDGSILARTPDAPPERDSRT